MTLVIADRQMCVFSSAKSNSRLTRALIVLVTALSRSPQQRCVPEFVVVLRPCFLLALLGMVVFGLASSYFLRFQNKCVIPCDCEPLELLSFKYRVSICKQYGSQVQVRMHFALNTTTFYTRKIRTLYNYSSMYQLNSVQYVRMIAVQ